MQNFLTHLENEASLELTIYIVPHGCIVSQCCSYIIYVTSIELEINISFNIYLANFLYFNNLKTTLLRLNF